MSAISSYTIRDLMPELLQKKPDLKSSKVAGQYGAKSGTARASKGAGGASAQARGYSGASSGSRQAGTSAQSRQGSGQRASGTSASSGNRAASGQKASGTKSSSYGRVELGPQLLRRVELGPQCLRWLIELERLARLELSRLVEPGFDVVRRWRLPRRRWNVPRRWRRAAQVNGDRAMKLQTRIVPVMSQMACVAGLAGLLLLSSGCKRAEPGTYATPEEAVQALNEIVGTRTTRRPKSCSAPAASSSSVRATTPRMPRPQRASRS